jgi:putative hydrolase of the HAD superfamily
VRAVLLDVFDTMLAVDFDKALDGLVAMSSLTRDEWTAGIDLHRHALMTGAATLEDAFTATFVLAGKPVEDVGSLVLEDRRLLQQHATLYPDVLPFIDEARSRGVAVAYISNCSSNAGPLLDALDLTGRADHVALSCSVGVVKPDPGIYVSTLSALGVEGGDAVFIDDQLTYCAGAAELGIRAVRINRGSVEAGAVASLSELLHLL